MPRQLPWKVGVLKAASGPGGFSGSPTSSPGQSPAPVDRSTTWPGWKLKSEGRDNSAPKPRRSLTARLDRSPSTSPPPEPPAEELMIEGLENDDRYRMVEDELFAVASNFTKHLHAAEYHRLKALANTRNADMIRTISRPVTGDMTEVVKRRQDAVRLAASQRRGLKKTLGKRRGTSAPSDTDDGSEQPGAGTSLRDLMDSPRKKKVPLSTVAGITGNTRASAGFFDKRHPGTKHGSRSEGPGLNPDSDTESDSVGLDSKPSLVSHHGARHQVTTMPVRHSPKRIGPTPERRREHQSPPRKLGAPRTGQEDSDQAQDSPAEDDGGDDFLSRIRDRRAKHRRRREPATSDSEAKTKAPQGRNSLDAIPLF